MDLDQLKGLKPGDFVHVNDSCVPWQVVSAPNCRSEGVHVPIKRHEGQWSISTATMHNFHLPVAAVNQICEKQDLLR